MDYDTASSQWGSDLYAHYGSPMITAADTIIVPVKTGANNFEVQAVNGSNGAMMWTQPSDYQYSPAVGTPPSGWTPSYSPTLTASGGMFYAGAGGTVYFRSNLDASGSATPVQLAFYDASGSSLSEYNASSATKAAFNNSIYIDTPITSDAAGNIYFGFEVNGTPPAGSGLFNGQGGLAKISYNPTTHAYSASYVTAANASGNSSMSKVVMNCAPAVSADGATVYVAVNQGNYSTGGSGVFLALNTSTLATEASVVPQDLRTNSPASISDQGTSSPTIGPNGDIYYGTLDNNGTSRGWLQHYQLVKNVSNYSFTSFTPGGFGWDDTVAIVPRSMVPSYHGSSSYLLMTKYNNYWETGGQGQNMIALLDPTAMSVDTRNNSTGQMVMQAVLTIQSPTPDPDGHPGDTEWCDNNAVVDPATDSILVTNEDGKLYRWNLTTDTLTQSIGLGGALGEAYTPTLIGPNGTVYAINNGVLYAIVPEPSTMALAAAGGVCSIAVMLRRWKRRAA